MSTRLASSFAALGLMVGALAAVLGTGLAPHYPVSAIEVFARAVVFTALVSVAAFAATYSGFLIRGEARTPQARQISFGTAISILWLPPLLIFAVQQSWLTVILWLVFLFQVARFLGSLQNQENEGGSQLRSASESPAFSVLKRDFPFASTILGALLLQSALFAAISAHNVLAGLFYLFGTAAMAYRTFQMFRAAPQQDAGVRERIAPVLGTVTLLTVFAWLPAMSIGGLAGSGLNGAGGGPLAAGGQSKLQGTGKRANTRQDATTLDWLRSLLPLPKSNSHPDSFAFAKRIFAAKFPRVTEQSETRTRSQHQTGIPNREPVMGPVFPGVELFPETAHRTKLMAPPPQRSSGFGAAHSDLLSIPFDGVYWFWKGPSQEPPPNAVVMHGSPSAQFFRSTDREIMSMEARESLGFSVDPRFYGAIEIVLENVDPFPNTVSIALRIRDSANPGKRFRSLGLARVASAGRTEDARPKIETLRFTVPATISSFDELIVTYYLRGERSDRSARIAIHGFRLVPRAG